MTKYILLLVFIGTVCSFACDAECKHQLTRIANALEKIAGIEQPKPVPKPVQEQVVANNWGQNLNRMTFEPRNQPTEFVFDDIEVEDTCEDKCKKTNYSDYTRKMCIEQNCREE